MEKLKDINIVRPVTGQRVYEEIKEAIINNTIKPGSMIQERVIAKKLGVSRTPVREALKKLSAEGLIELIPGRGAMVTKITIEDIREIMQVREPLECLAAKLAAERVTLRDIEYLEAMVSSWKQEIDNTTDIDFVSISRWDIGFHEYIVEIARNNHLAHLLSIIRDQIRRITFMTQDNKHRIETSLSQHIKILEALKRKDPRAAEENMREHMESIRRYYFERFGLKEM